MIRIVEQSPTIKLSGTSSLLVSFPYNDRLVELVRSYVPAIWHKKLGVWEVGINYLGKMLDDFCKIDAIDFTKLESNRNSESFVLTDAEIAGFKIKPFPHQVDAINFLLSREKSLVLDAPGVGKSLEMMYYAETLYNRGLIDHCLLITGVASLRQQWKSEIKKFSKLPVMVLGEKVSRKGKVSYAAVKDRAEQLKNKIDEFWIIMNVESLRDDKIVEAFNKSTNKIDLICFDEIHRGVANKNSQSASGLLKLNPKYKVGATGSLIVNSPISAYMSLFWTDNDHATLTNFKNQYCQFAQSAFTNYQIVGYQNLDMLQEEIDSCSIRRTFDQIKSSMPKKTIDVELVEMNDRHSKFYDAIKDGVKEEADKIELKANNLLALCTRLRQATSDTSILTSEVIPTSKIDRAVEIAEDLLDAGEKVIIMDMFKSSVYSLEKALKKYNPVLGTGDQADADVISGISKFKTDPACNLLLGTAQKIGTGLSIPECHYMIMLSTPWTYSEFNQNCERIYRITSDQPVFIKVLLTKDTIDERVWQIVNQKKDLADYLVDGKMTESFADEMRAIIKDL